MFLHISRELKIRSKAGQGPYNTKLSKLLGSFRASFWARFRSLFQLVFSSEKCTPPGTHVGAFFTATCSVEVPHSPLKPIDGRCLRSLPGSLSRTRWGHFRSPNGSYWNPWWPHFGVIFMGPKTQALSPINLAPLDLLVTARALGPLPCLYMYFFGGDG